MPTAKFLINRQLIAKAKEAVRCNRTTALTRQFAEAVEVEPPIIALPRARREEFARLKETTLWCPLGSFADDQGATYDLYLV